MSVYTCERMRARIGWLSSPCFIVIYYRGIHTSCVGYYKYKFFFPTLQCTKCLEFECFTVLYIIIARVFKYLCVFFIYPFLYRLRDN